MRLLSFLLIVIINGMCACVNSTANGVKTKSLQNNTHKKVLVELFTSQGCSSCPSADKLVSNLAQTDTDLVVLSFHVDYWDRLGWKDVFSNHTYTLRQEQYVQVLHAESAYTPQAVIQGEFEMVGSNQNGISAALAKAREQSDDVMLTANATQSNSVIHLQYQVDKIKPKEQLLVALVQTHTSTSVQRGENSGVQLEGYNVVRSLETLSLIQKEGEVKINLSPDLKEDNASVVLFVQDVLSKKIEAVTQVKL